MYLLFICCVVSLAISFLQFSCHSLLLWELQGSSSLSHFFFQSTVQAIVESNHHIQFFFLFYSYYYYYHSLSDHSLVFSVFFSLISSRIGNTFPNPNGTKSQGQTQKITYQMKRYFSYISIGHMTIEVNVMLSEEEQQQCSLISDSLCFSVRQFTRYHAWWNYFFFSYGFVAGCG